MASSEAAKEAVWLRKFLMELGVIVKVVDPMIMHCDGLLLKTKNQGIIGKAST